MSIYKRTVLVVEDDDFIRSLVADALQHSGFTVHSAVDVAGAKQVLAKHDPDAAIIDIDLGSGANGLDLGESLAKSAPEIAIVYLTALADPRLAGGPARKISPTAAYLNKRELLSIETVVEALERVLRDKDLNQYRHDLSKRSPISRLSTAQLEVLKLLASGYTNQQISVARGKSLSATEAIISRVFTALDIDTKTSNNARVQAVNLYLASGGKATSEDNA